MLTIQELALLYHIARDHYTGEGEIVDGGPLLGIGTNAMAKGLLANRGVSNKTKRIFSFDLFLRDEMADTVEHLANLTNSVFEGFLQVNRDYLDQIYISPGNLLAHRWSGSPVEVLFIDIAKSWELNRFVVEQFFRCLIPGKSIVIQQDYVYFHGYWIHLTMEALHDHFELLDVVFGASAVFRCIKPITSIDMLALQNSPISVKTELMDRAIGHMPASAQEVMRCTKAYCLLVNGFKAAAGRELDRVRTDIGSDDPARDFRVIASSNKEMVRGMIDAAP